jgi:hypothetical protein
MKIRVTREYSVTIPDDIRYNQIVTQMVEAAEVTGHPCTAEDFEPSVIRGNMAMFLIKYAEIGDYTDLVEEIDYNVWDAED